MERIVIVGCPGAGKSTAARRLAALTGLPLIHLDRHYWQPGWVRPGEEAWRESVRALAQGPRWIIDGNYGGTLEIRLEAADTLIHLDYPTQLCLWRVFGRTLANWGRERADEPIAGCPERFDWPFLRFVLNYRRRFRARDMAKMSRFGGTLHRFSSPRALEAFFASLEAGRLRAA